MWTKEAILTQVEKSDKSITWGLIRLWEKQEFTAADAEICNSMAQQAVWKRREIERGDRSENSPLLSAKQIELARTLLRKYWPQLVRIANRRRPDLGQQAAYAYGIPASDRPRCDCCGEEACYQNDDFYVCGHCSQFYERARNHYPYELTPDDRALLYEEMGLPYHERQRASRIETETLVIEGRNIRFKKPRELAWQYETNRYGMPREMVAELDKSMQQIGLGRGASTAAVRDEEDPFSF